MSIPRLPIALLVVGIALPPTIAADSNLEAEAQKALAAGDAEALRRLAAEYRQVAPEARRALPVRIREDAVEFVFRGEFHGDQYLPDGQEYLVATSGKAYETLVVVGPDEAGRLQGLRQVFADRSNKGRGKTWSARLVWADGDMPHAIEYSDLLVRMKPDDRAAYLDGIAIGTTPSLGSGTNVPVDPGVLPTKRVPARLYLTVQLVPKR